MNEYFPSQENIKEGVSLICSLKNRNENLGKALPSWTCNPHINEIIIVDWDSDEPVQEIVDRHQNGKIMLAHVLNQPKWIASWAHNLAARLTSYSQILKLDADIVLSGDFFEKCVISPGSFFAGNLLLARSDNERHLQGQMYFYRDDFFEINGFDERITTYGWEDEDIVNRLEFDTKEIIRQRKKSGKYWLLPCLRIRRWLPPNLRNIYTKFYNKQKKQVMQTRCQRGQRRKRKDISPDLLYHIPHTDEKRVAHQNVHPDKLHIENRRNQLKVRIPWNAQYAMKQYDITKIDDYTLICRMK